MNVTLEKEQNNKTMLIHPQVFDRAGEQWFILHTLSNQEMLLANALQAMDVAYFLPLRRIQRMQGRLKSHVTTPLFPSYLFIRGCLDSVYRADRTKRVASVVRVYDQARLESEIRCIHMALLHEGVIEPHPYLKRGVSVEVRSGPFRGMRGLISDKTKYNCLILQVDLLGQATALEIDGSLLEPI